jgi:hypothetical protein
LDWHYEIDVHALERSEETWCDHEALLVPHPLQIRRANLWIDGGDLDGLLLRPNCHYGEEKRPGLAIRHDEDLKSAVEQGHLESLLRSMMETGWRLDDHGKENGAGVGEDPR